jgi:hypothetical protein
MTDQAINGSVNLGNASTVYVSIPDQTATSSLGDQCQGLSLPSLPASYSYHCPASSTYRNIDGTGWLPVKFSSMSQGSPLGQLPIDPVNQSSTRNYDTYTTNGSQYELTTALESSKYKLGGSNDSIGNDGGTLAGTYERGTKLGLEPLDYGDSSLVGYWTFDEGTGSTTYDYSGQNATGSWQGTPTGTIGYYSPGRIGNWAGAFDGGSTYVAIPTENLSKGFTYSVWLNPSCNLDQRDMIGGGDFFKFSGGGGNIETSGWFSTPSYVSTAYTPATNTWQYAAVTFDGIGSVMLYKNGVSLGTFSVSGFSGVTSKYIGSESGSNRFWCGLIDDVRIYNRALSAAEIAAMYNGIK